MRKSRSGNRIGYEIHGDTQARPNIQQLFKHFPRNSINNCCPAIYFGIRNWERAINSARPSCASTDMEARRLTPHKTKLPAAEHAYRSIRAAIVSGHLEEGERLIEERLSEDLGLSRTPVREAIRRLTQEGFIERHGGYNTRVATFPADEMEQTFHIRQMLESYAAERAARLATDEDIASIRALSDLIARSTPPQSPADYQKISEANEAFHRKIVEAARSTRLTALMSTAFDIGMVDRTYRRYSTEELVRSANHHCEIADAIAARAPDWAGAAMRTHIRAAEVAAAKSSQLQDAAE